MLTLKGGGSEQLHVCNIGASHNMQNSEPAVQRAVGTAVRHPALGAYIKFAFNKVLSRISPYPALPSLRHINAVCYKP